MAWSNESDCSGARTFHVHMCCLHYSQALRKRAYNLQYRHRSHHGLKCSRCNSLRTEHEPPRPFVRSFPHNLTASCYSHRVVLYFIPLPICVYSASLQHLAMEHECVGQVCWACVFDMCVGHVCCASQLQAAFPTASGAPAAASSPAPPTPASPAAPVSPPAPSGKSWPPHEVKTLPALSPTMDSAAVFK